MLHKVKSVLFFFIYKIKRLGQVSPKSVFVGNVGSIVLGEDVNINRYATLQTGATGLIKVGNRSIVDSSAIVRAHGGEIEIGINCSLGCFSYINGSGGVCVGDNVRIASHVSIISNNHIFDDVFVNISEQGLSKKGITIEDNVWIGTGVKILDGVVIGKGTVIGAGSVITKSIPQNSIVVGVPGKVIRTRC